MCVTWLFEQDASKRSAKVLIEDCVDDRIEGGIHVSEPEGNGETPRSHVARRTQRLQDVQEEKGQPAENEGAHDQAENQCRSLLLFSRDSPLLPLRISHLLRWHNHEKNKRREIIDNKNYTGYQSTLVSSYFWHRIPAIIFPPSSNHFLKLTIPFTLVFSPLVTITVNFVSLLKVNSVGQ